MKQNNSNKHSYKRKQINSKYLLLLMKQSNLQPQKKNNILESSVNCKNSSDKGPKKYKYPM
jgi:hypothetical protein